MKRVFALLYLLLLPCAALPLYAATGDPCAEDSSQFCREVKPGGGRMAQCLLEHEHQLTADCLEHQQILQRKARKIVTECRDDVEKFCMDVSATDRHIIRCLLQNKTAVSPECQEKLDAGK